VWALAQSRRIGHRSLMTPKRVLSKYNEDLISFCTCYLLVYLSRSLGHELFGLRVKLPHVTTSLITQK